MLFYRVVVEACTGGRIEAVAVGSSLPGRAVGGTESGHIIRGGDGTDAVDFGEYFQIVGAELLRLARY